MSKPDYKLKSKILKEYTNFDLYNKCQKVLYRYSAGSDVSKNEFDHACLTLRYLEKRDPQEYKEYGRISHAKCARVVRLKKRILGMLVSGDCLFLTLTFNDEAFKYNTADSRRQAVRRFLNELNAFDYVANIDFGKKNGREHYHAVVAIDKIDYKKWTYGAINGQKVRNSIKFDDDGVVKCESVEKIARYVAKLTNHAIKETTKRSTIIYARKSRIVKPVTVNDNVFDNDEPILDLFVQGELNL